MTPCSNLRQRFLEARAKLTVSRHSGTNSCDTSFTTYLTSDADSDAKIGGGCYKIFTKQNSLMFIRLSLFN